MLSGILLLFGEHRTCYERIWYIAFGSWLEVNRDQS